MSEFFELFGVLGAIAAAGSIGYLLVGAVHITLRRMARRARLASESDSEEQLRELAERVDVLERQVERMAELEERVDFAERHLAQRGSPRLPAAGS